MKYIAILLLLTATSFITCYITQKEERKKTEQRIFMLFGEGDYGQTVNYVVQTGDTIAEFMLE